MVTNYNTKDLVNFGNYVLSDERAKMIKNHPHFRDDEEHLKQRLSQVNHADVENWKEKNANYERLWFAKFIAIKTQQAGGSISIQSNLLDEYDALVRDGKLMEYFENITMI